MNNVASQVKQFMRDEVFMLTLIAVVSRGRVYGSKRTEEDSARFKCCLREQLKRMEETYRQCVDSELHIRNIESLAKNVSASCEKSLYKSRFRIGSAQKALNLSLKYLWCLGEIPEPPHCPFDSRIIELLPKGVQCNWTQCDDIEHYERWVAAAREEAKKESLSLAQWELCTYNRE